METKMSNVASTSKNVADQVAAFWWETEKSFTYMLSSKEDFAEFFISRIRNIFPEADNKRQINICREVVKIVCRTKEYKEKRERNQHILYGLLYLMAEFKIKNRKLVRDMLTILFIYTGFIDREVFLFDHEQRSMQNIKQKQEYVFQQVAAWKLPQKEPWTQCPSCEYYIDLPLRRADNEANTHLMTEAIYHQRDPELFLTLLQAGAYPSCLYLLPVCIILDFKLSFLEIASDDPDFLSEESKIIRYFCRNRHFIDVHIVNRDRNVYIADLPASISFDDVLLMSPMSINMVPLERYKVPSSLMHQSRLAVRNTLLHADNLPEGIPQLGLPKVLEEYVNLKID